MTEHEGCQALLHSLSDYIDGELNPEVCAWIDQHLAGCNNCRIVIDSLKRTISLYQTIQSEQSDLPAQVRQRLYKHLELDEFLQK